LLLFGPSDDATGFISSVWDTTNDRAVLTKTPDVLDWAWLDGDRLGAVTADGHGRVIDVRTGETREVPIDIEPGNVSIVRVADGRIAFGYEGGRVDVFDFDTATRVATLRPSNASSGPDGWVGTMAPSADGTRLYVMYVPGRGLHEFDLTDGRELQWYRDSSSDTVAAAGAGPLAIGHTDGTVTLHDPDDLTLVGTLPGARSYASVMYDSNGRFLVVRGADGTMALYDVARRQRMGDPIDVGDVGVALRPDGLEIAVAGGDPLGLTLWSLDPATLIDAACRIAGRNLSLTEWDTYIGDLAPYRATCPQYPVPTT
jgi:WD40 repeat protein